MTLFPVTIRLEYVALDLLGPLLKATTGDRFILVMTDRRSVKIRQEVENVGKEYCIICSSLVTAFLRLGACEHLRPNIISQMING